MQTECIRLYCGAGNETARTHAAYGGRYACVSPVYGLKKVSITRVSLPPDTEVFQDSGAFTDNISARLTFMQAFERQLNHAYKFGYSIFAQAAYDVLIDETWDELGRHKQRWSVGDAESAIDSTVAAAKWISNQRDNTPAKHLILSAQGVDSVQYLRCTERIMPYLETGDIFGMGGWCIIGKMPRVMMPTFEETVRRVIPFIAREGVKRAHIWGVCYAPAIGMLNAIADEYGISVSTDSAGPILRPTFGEWGYDNWRHENYKRPVGQVDMAQAMTEHAQATRQWLADFKTRSPKHYKLPRTTLL